MEHGKICRRFGENERDERELRKGVA